MDAAQVLGIAEGEVQAVAGMSDLEAARLLGVAESEVAVFVTAGRVDLSGYPVDGTVAEVLAWVGDDPARAQVALQAEQERPRPRRSVIDTVEGVLA